VYFAVVFLWRECMTEEAKNSVITVVVVIGFLVFLTMLRRMPSKVRWRNLCLDQRRRFLLLVVGAFLAWRITNSAAVEPLFFQARMRWNYLWSAHQPLNYRMPLRRKLMREKLGYSRIGII